MTAIAAESVTWCRAVCLLILLALLSGCASFGRGMTEAVLDAQARESEDRRACSVDGQAFTGIAPTLAQQESHGSLGADSGRPTTKLLYVHGIGDHQPGHGGRLMRSLASTLDLSVRAENFKRIELAPRIGPERPMGEVNVVRMVDTARERELLFFELTWSPITQPEKEAIKFDSSEIYTSQRAGINQSFRTFANRALPDPLAFAGNRGSDIRDAVGQAMCWALSATWDGLPQSMQGQRCETSAAYGSRVGVDELVIATHSLGSRATMDALQDAAQKDRSKNASQIRFAEALQRESITIFMLSNQLPLLESGQDSQAVTGQHDQFCGTDAPRADQRFLRQLDLIAVTDPNDIMSYPVPTRWVDQYLDSRLCTRVRNVTINIANVRTLPVVGQFADPLAAHSGYVDDERVAQLMANGIGHPGTTALVRERCSWIEVDPALN